MSNWVSMHIFYASNPNLLLNECIAPLIRRLRREDLIQRYFWLRYWLEGPHVRLRLLPGEGSAEHTAPEVAETAVREFLARHPSARQPARENTGATHKTMFITEYGESRWNADYGPAGEMPLRADNSVEYVSYSPEYGRYGGTKGVELSEWHFECSSDIVLRLLDSTNAHVRTVLLGLSLQQTLAMCYAFLENERKVADFLGNYQKFWERNFLADAETQHRKFEAGYQQMAEKLQSRVDEVRGAALLGDGSAEPSPPERAWIDHCHELRDHIRELATGGQLAFRTTDRPGDDGKAEDPDTALTTLLTSYIHMTNNRLGASVPDEIYLSYLLRRALSSSAGAS